MSIDSKNTVEGF